MWEEEVNAGNGESARFDVYNLTLGSNVLMVLDKNKEFQSSGVAQPGRKVRRGLIGCASWPVASELAFISMLA